jgi:hypothetical protein
MNAPEMETELRRVLEEAFDTEEMPWSDPNALALAGVCSFEEAGVMTHNSGLVVSVPDGSEFQLTIVQCAFARAER